MKLFPHLLKPDRELWQEFLETDFNIYAHFDYDVHVGVGRDPGPDFPDHIRQMALNISQRRIDAIGFMPQSITIIEISINAGLTQLGQVMAYPCLYQKTIGSKLPIKVLLLARTIQTDIEPVLKEHQIPYIVLSKEDS